ncbi:MAG: hypothetical protein Unbinned5350contig1004_54 [Prokaryotic dsDNA virus sp.]|nr:MAG: hypothetical protein Unbinned5350contig1004_54 [Prokaryotic dsDNA virus sp.]|tara:strand:+ start:5928 stop:6326 length:399 start_codon:yes stop_codon:yes gene_type:complete
MPQRSIPECNAALDARNALLNGGSVEIRTGAPGDIDSAPTGTVQVTFTLPSTAFGAASNRISTANAVTAVTASNLNAGATVHYVAKDSGGNARRNGTAGTASANMILNTLTWSSGDDVSITSWSNSELKGSN